MYSKVKVASSKSSMPSVLTIVGGMILIGLVVMTALYMQKYVMEKFDSPMVKFYSMEGCPHCVAFKPEWDSFESNAKGYGIATEQIDSKDPRTSAAGIKGFPTIVVTVNGTDMVYNGERTASALTKFVTDKVNA